MKASYLLGLFALASLPAHADVLEARLQAFDAVIPCAAQLTNLRTTQVDVSLPTGEFFGGNPGMYERCVAPRLREAGLRAPSSRSWNSPASGRGKRWRASSMRSRCVASARAPRSIRGR